MYPLNRVSAKVKPEELQKVIEAVKIASNILKPYLITLPAEERMIIPKMNEAAFPFVQKALEFARTETSFVPETLNVDELQIDLEAVKNLLKALSLIEDLYHAVNDTVNLSSSEAYMASLAYYNSVKLEAKFKNPVAVQIVKELRSRFTGVESNTEPTIMPKKKLEAFTWNYLIASGRLSAVE